MTTKTPTGQTSVSAAAELEQLQLDRDRRVARITLLILLLPTVWFLRTDLWLAAQGNAYLNERFAVRMLFLSFLFWGSWRLGSVADRATYERIVLAIGLGTAACIFTLNLMRPAGSSLSLRTPLMWLLAYYSGLVTRPGHQVVAPLLVSAGLVGVRLFWANGDATGDVGGDIVVILIMNAIGLQLVRHRESLQRRERELWTAELAARHSLEHTLSELKQLRGIIPICAYCRQVRTEVGDWRGIEEYIREHSEAEFSHGMCPSCAATHFPEEFGAASG